MSLRIGLLALALFITTAISGIVSGQSDADQFSFDFSTGFEAFSLGPLDAFEEEICHLNDAAFLYQPVYNEDWLKAFSVD